MTNSQDLLALLAPELKIVRETGRDPADLEPVLGDLPTLLSLPVVSRWTRHPATTMATAEAVSRVVWRAVERLNKEVLKPRLARIWFGLDLDRDLDPPAARRRAQAASPVEMRQFRKKWEDDLARLVAQQVLQLQADEDRLNAGRLMMVGAEVPQSVGMYWLRVFADHYFRLETSAYALQVDLMTALQKHRDDMPDWRKFARLALWWNVEFSYYRDRFFSEHGPLWFTPTDEGGEALSESAENIEYHDAFPEEYISQLRLLCASLDRLTHASFDESLRASGHKEFAEKKFESWLGLCKCNLEKPNYEHCEVHIVIHNCERLGDTVEREFSLIQNWYRTERYAVDPSIRDRILNFRRPDSEQRNSEAADFRSDSG
ncbi:hypothetical protein ACQP2K_03405 [Microbispora siamensis]